MLTKLGDVNLLDYHLVRAVGSMCPHLTHVVFNIKGADLENDPDYDSDNAVDSETIGDSESAEIESNLTVSLNEWPKVGKFIASFILFFITKRKILSYLYLASDY